MKDPYKVLGVPSSADTAQIKKAYREITRRFHPDKNPGDKAAEDKFKDASQAYEVLGDDEKRKLWDEFGEMSLTSGFDATRARAYKQAGAGGFHGAPGSPFGGGHPGGFHFDDMGSARATSFDDLLSKLFGGGRVQSDVFSQRRPSSARGRDIGGEIRVSLHDSIHGVTVPLRIEGADKSARTLDVKVPPGISDGGKLRLRGQGGPGQPPGDILLTVRVNEDDTLRREGNNLHQNVPVSAFRAYEGGPLDVATPWGAVTVKIPAGSQSGQVLRLRGKGVKRGKTSGDLYLRLEVVLPAPGDPALLEALRRLQGETEPVTPATANADAEANA